MTRKPAVMKLELDGEVVAASQITEADDDWLRALRSSKEVREKMYERKMMVGDEE